MEFQRCEWCFFLWDEYGGGGFVSGGTEAAQETVALQYRSHPKSMPNPQREGEKCIGK